MEAQKDFNKETEKIRKYQMKSQAEEYNNLNEKYTESFNSRLNEEDKRISDLGDRATELNQTGKQKEKKLNKKTNIP